MLYFLMKLISYNRVFTLMYEKVRFLDLIKFTNKAESVYPWNLIISTSLNLSLVCDCLSQISLVLFFRLVCLVTLNKARVYNRS